MIAGMSIIQQDLDKTVITTTRNIGITEGMVMFLLSMQTGLIDMKLPQRLGAMSIILFIVAASLFQTILEITHPVLLALSASSRNIWSHIKVNNSILFS